MTGRAQRKPRQRMPSDSEIREALVESGVSEREADRAVAQWPRVFGLDFLKRRTNRLLGSVQERMIVIAAKRKVLAILTKEARAEQKALNVEDLFTGVHQAVLANLGEIVIRRALRELAAEGVVRLQDESGAPELASLTGRQPEWSTGKLRDVYQRMRSAMAIREEKPYEIEKRWDL